MPASLDPHKHARQLANLQQGSETPRAEPKRLKTLRTRYEQELPVQFPHAAPQEITLLAARQAQLDTLIANLDKQPARHDKQTLRETEIFNRLATVYERQFRLLRDEEKRHGQKTLSLSEYLAGHDRKSAG